VSSLLEDVPTAWQGISVGQLLSHTSDIPDNFDESYYALLESRAHDLLNDEVDASAFVDLMRGRRLVSAPGTAFRYSNGGYFLLGQIIEAASGETYPEFIADAVTAPLEMHSTTYYEPIVLTPGRVRAYLDDEGGYINNPNAALSGNASYSVGAMESSVDDLARFAQALLAGELLSSATVERMFEVRTPNLMPSDRLSAPMRYDYGVFIGRLQGHRMVWQDGDRYGSAATLVILPDDRIVVAIATNDPHHASRDLNLIARQAAAVLLGEPYPGRERVEVPTEQLERLTGTYAEPGGSRYEVSIEEGRLSIRPDGGLAVEAIPAGSNRFFFSHTLTDLTFEVDEAGHAVRMILHRDDKKRTTASMAPEQSDGDR